MATQTINEPPQRKGQEISERPSGGVRKQAPQRYRPRGATGDQATDRGIESGRRYAQEITGQSTQQTGRDVQDITSRRRQRLEGASPGQTELREMRNRRIAMARSRGASPAEQRQIEASAQTALAREGFRQEGQALGDYQSLIGNIMRNQQAITMGFGQLGKAGEQPATAPEGTGITVVCTALREMGDLDRRSYIACLEYGKRLAVQEEDFHLTYLKMFTPVADRYKAKSWYRFLTRFLLVRWARHFKDDNFIGRKVHHWGVWRIKARMKRDGS